jgi:hypothetical protein
MYNINYINRRTHKMQYKPKFKLVTDPTPELKVQTLIIQITNQSHYRPGQAKRVPRSLRFPEFKTIGT